MVEKGERPGAGAGSARRDPPWFVAGDLDGFFGLAIDNLIQFLLILGLCTGVLGFDSEWMLVRILPGAALSVLMGNLYYAWQARQLARATGRTDITALPYGINTVSLFAFVLLIMLPVKHAAQGDGATPEQAAEIAWRVGLAACFVAGVLEILGSFVGAWVRRNTPRAALLSTLAGIAISFIAIDFAVRTFERPLVAMPPLAVILVTYFARWKLPLRMPGGLWAVLIGASAAWILAAAGEPTPVSIQAVSTATDSVQLCWPSVYLTDLWAGLTDPQTRSYLVTVMVPMGLFGVLGSLQNLESAEAAGDAFPTRPSMLVNGAGTLLASVCGSCFPTTLYIGHPGWKEMGARSGYSLLNGVFFAIMALLGLTAMVKAIVPLEAGMAIVLWIGIIMTSQAFQATPREHAPAVAVGLFPAIAAWGVVILGQALNAAGIASGDGRALVESVIAAPEAFAIAGLRLDGMVALYQGFMLTCMIWAAACALLIDRRFRSAALWMFWGAGFSFLGFMHAGQLTPDGPVYDIGINTGGRWALGYALCGVLFLAMDLPALRRRNAA